METHKPLLPVLYLALAILLLGSCQVLPATTPTIPYPSVMSPVAPGPTVLSTAIPTAPVPTAPPPTPPPTCIDKASFDSDVTVPPGTIFLPGQSFVKTWRLRNAGTCTWSTDYALVFYSGERLGGAAGAGFPSAVPPGATVDLSVALVAPAGAGNYEGRWLLRNASGNVFGIAESADGTFGVRIVVETSQPMPTTVTVTPTATPRVTAVPTVGPTPIITDWRGEYFSNPDLAGSPTLVRNDTAVDFNWGQGAPADGLPSDGFSVRWTRTLNFDSGPYRFHAQVDDGVRLWVDERLVLDDWRDGAQREVVGDWAVLAGNHSVRVEYYERAAEALVIVGWDRIADLYPDWEGQYWPNPDLSGQPVLVQNEGTIDFNWGTGSVAGGLPADNFSARWMRIASFEAATYRFHVVVDDGARMWVDNRLIVDAWHDGAVREVTADVSLTRGDHLLRVEYYERGGEAQVHVSWEKITPGTTPTSTSVSLPTGGGMARMMSSAAVFPRPCVVVRYV